MSAPPNDSQQSAALSWAALAYALYGFVYLWGAIGVLNPSRMITFWGVVPWWAFYLVGLAFMMSLPYLVLRGIRWLIFSLSFFTAFKTLWLFYMEGRHFAESAPVGAYNIFFAVVAMGASLTLLAAGLRTQRN